MSYDKTYLCSSAHLYSINKVIILFKWRFSHTPKNYCILADGDLTAKKVRAHVSDHESFVFPRPRLQRLGKARKFDAIYGFVIAVTNRFQSQLLSAKIDADSEDYICPIAREMS